MFLAIVRLCLTTQAFSLRIKINYLTNLICFLLRTQLLSSNSTFFVSATKKKNKKVNYDFLSCSSDLKSQDCEMESCHYQMPDSFFILWQKQAAINNRLFHCKGQKV